MIVGVIYRVSNKLNGKYYIGQTTRKVGERWSLHKSEARNRPKAHFHKAIRKHGERVFVVDVLDRAETLEELNALEEGWIKHLCAMDPMYGYNHLAGGENYTRSPATLAKMSAAGRRKVISARTRALISLASKGRPHTKEHASKIAASLRGRSPSLKCRLAVANANRNRTLSVETRAKLSLAAQKANRARWHRA